MEKEASHKNDGSEFEVNLKVEMGGESVWRQQLLTL